MAIITHLHSRMAWRPEVDLSWPYVAAAAAVVAAVGGPAATGTGLINPTLPSAELS